MTELYVPKKQCFAETRNKMQQNHRFYQNFIYGSCDAGWIFSDVFTEEVRKEFEKRGWDITTLKFSIAPKLVNPTRPDRFTTLLKRYEKDIKELEENG